MERAAHNRILGEIESFLNWSPLPLSPNASAKKCAALVAPNLFYYQHLDERLTLKKIASTKKIITNLSDTVERTLKSIKAKDALLSNTLRSGRFPTLDKPHTYKEPIVDARSVAEAYRSVIAKHGTLIASMLFLSPHSPKWQAVVFMAKIESSPRDNPALEEGYAFGIEDHVGEMAVSDKVWESIDKGTCRMLCQPTVKHPALARWEIFAVSPETEGILKDMEDLPTRFTCYEKRATVEFTSSLVPLPSLSDAKSTSWGEPLMAFLNLAPASDKVSRLDNKLSPELRVRRTTRSKSQQTAKTKGTKVVSETWGNNNSPMRSQNVKSWKTLKVPPMSGTEVTEGSMAASVLQHAWLRAVRSDTTFIIFNCGNFERIGFRHRHTQTLFLSDLIDVPNCKNPGYSKIHVGLYMSIIHDYLDRMSQKTEPDAKSETIRKRRREDNAIGIISKRPKTRAAAAMELAEKTAMEQSYELLNNVATHRNLALIQMCYGVYNSPAPNYFLREGHNPDENKSYEPHEYILLTLTSDIAAGATGIVHNATLEFVTDDMTLRDIQVVVKLAFKSHQQTRMRHEFTIYEHLTSSGVQGIPHIFGIFQDPVNNVLALVMSHVGICLTTLYPGELQTIVLEPKRSAFLTVMKAIHSSGVRHRDIRPENLTIDNEGNVFIIDFDKAQLNSTGGSRERELIHLTELLDGHYSPPGEFPSEGTSDSEAYETDNVLSPHSDSTVT